ncbi:PQ-loop domain-containing transporter [Ureaplasma miroungigenitalium]|uniref:PQ-loop repeat-containing protein n=1 Tax=Ureaplasma miroungigenitalium TaxID=1042321 RepID=UPI0021E8DE9E|nr:PQ-loop repeat-containing protein [Ureaplasma miroungigenitalium]MCV3734497.1 PQ-loop domain-containing transporter [Ureaplasma miroungigenitalium]
MWNSISDIPNFYDEMGNINLEVSAHASATEVATSVFSAVGTTLLALSVLPQTIKTLKSKDTAQLNFWLFLLTGLASAFLAIYGVGLATVSPYAKVFAVGKFINEQNETVLVFNYQRFIAGYLVPGIIMCVGSSLLSITALMVAFLKFKNARNAKSMNLSETDYYQQYILTQIKQDKAPL